MNTLLLKLVIFDCLKTICVYCRIVFNCCIMLVFFTFLVVLLCVCVKIGPVKGVAQKRCPLFTGPIGNFCM